MLSNYFAPLVENEYTIKDTLESLCLLKDHTVHEDEILALYDVSSLFIQKSPLKRPYIISFIRSTMITNYSFRKLQRFPYSPSMGIYTNKLMGAVWVTRCLL